MVDITDAEFVSDEDDETSNHFIKQVIYDENDENTIFNLLIKDKEVEQ